MFEVRMPKFGLSMEEGTITKWYKNVGDYVKKGEPLVEVETEKIVNTLESPFEGVLIEIKVPANETAKVGEVIAIIGEKEESLSEAKTQGEIIASPLAKKLAKEHNIDLRLIKGSGPNGRITEKDVLDYIEKNKTEVKETPTKKVSIDPVRRRIIENLSKSYRESVLVTNVTKCDVSNLINLKNEFQNITLTAFFVKIVAEVLKEFPKFNAHFNGNEIIEFNEINIGVAFDTDKGLIVPVIKNVQALSLSEISSELEKLKSKVKENKLSYDDLTHSTFTITNLGMLRTDFFTPVLNGQEVAILGIGRILKEPVYEGQAFIPKDFVYFSLSYDHRVIDGADAARFLGALAQILEVKESLLKLLK